MDSKDPIPLKISDYDVFPVLLPPQPCLSQAATHFMYLKPHDPKVRDIETPRSLFVVNVPLDSTVSHMKQLFSTQVGLPAGRIASVEFVDRHKPYSEDLNIVPSLPAHAPSRKRKREQEILDKLPVIDASLPELWDRTVHHPGTNAVVIFVDKTSMESALKAARRAAKEGRSVIWGKGVEEGLPPLGSSRYMRHADLLYPDEETLRHISDDYLKAFDAHIVARDRILAEQRQIPDEDGFITVTRSSGRGGVKGVKQETAKEKLKKQKEKEGLTDFYRFQGREQAKQRSKELVNKFHEDVERVRQIRERRGRPRVSLKPCHSGWDSKRETDFA